MFIQAFPGDGVGKGLEVPILYYISEDIREHYDIVFYDQRGIGLSNLLACRMHLKKISSVIEGG